MPNTLVHIAIQTPLTRLGMKEAPLQWIAVGCIIPDIPWIVQRIFTYFPGIDTLNLRLYTVTQASLIYCLILSLALSMLTSKSKQIFLILATNSLFHLLLDAVQNKWGNGVNLLVPFSWHSTNFELLWPEHFSSYLLAFAGILVFIILWPKAIRNTLFLQRPRKIKTLCAATCLIIYFSSPSLLLNNAYAENTHYSQTLNDIKTRTGKKLEIDRATYKAATNTLECYIDKQLKIINIPKIESGTISVRGHFLDEKTIELKEFHVHEIFRDYASYTGLFLTLLLWSHTFFYQKSTHRNL